MKYDGKNNFPAYDEVIEQEIKPLIERDGKFFDLFAAEDDPAEAAYQYGLQRMWVVEKEAEKRGAEKTFKKLKANEDRPRTTTKGGAKPHAPVKRTADDIMNMSNADVEKEITAVTGRIQ